MYAMQPITYTTGSEIQAPYRVIVQPGNVESGVALGPASRLAGEVLARHVSQPGMVWGKFSSQNTRAVDQYDPMVSGALTTQWALASDPYNTLDLTGNKTNIMSYAQQSAMSQTAPVSQTTATSAKDAQKEAKKAEKAQKAAAKAARMAAAREAKKAKKAAAAAGNGGACKNGSCSTCE